MEYWIRCINWKVKSITLMNHRADLHIHSCYSDSDLSIRDIFTEAKQKELKAIAITDHDTVEGLIEAERIQKDFGVELIPGVELSCEHKDVEVHILGYFIDCSHPKLVTALEDIKEIRKARLLKMVEKLEKVGIEIDTDKLFESIGNRVATRLHLALHMLQEGKVSSVWEAFKRYLSPGKPAYVARFKFSVREGIQLIKASGGIPALAHPHFLPNKDWIGDFADWGLMAIEVVYPKFTSQMTDFFVKIAEKYNLFPVGGSDSHGSFKEFTGIGQITIPYGWVENLKKVRDHLSSFTLSKDEEG